MLLAGGTMIGVPESVRLRHKISATDPNLLVVTRLEDINHCLCAVYSSLILGSFFSPEYLYLHDDRIICGPQKRSPVRFHTLGLGPLPTAASIT